MKNKLDKKKVVFILFLFLNMLGFNSRLLAQQESLYSQYMFNMMSINPAYAGSEELQRFSMIMRNQWTSFPGAPVTGSLSYDQRIGKSNSNIGLQLYTDKIGIEHTTGMKGFYSFSARFEKSALRMGLAFGLMNYKVIYSNTDPNQQQDPKLMEGVNLLTPTFGFGLLYSGIRWNLAISSPDLIKSTIRDNNAAVIQQVGKEGHFFVYSGYIIPVSPIITLKPSVLGKIVSGTPLQADLNINVWLGDKIGVGGSYRIDNAWVGIFEFKITSRLKMGYAYDYSISELKYYSGGTHELMLKYEISKAKEEVLSILK